MPVCCFYVILPVLLCISACSVRDEMRTQAYRTGLEAPFDNTCQLDSAPRDVYAAVLSELAASRAKITAQDDAMLFVAWAGWGMSFTDLMGNQQRGLASSLVYGSARVKPVDQGSILYVYARKRLAYSGKTRFSNGDYERRLLRRVGEICSGEARQP